LCLILKPPISPLTTVPYAFLYLLFLFNDTATTEIYTLSLHDALPIYAALGRRNPFRRRARVPLPRLLLRRRGQLRAHPIAARPADRKSTRLNSSHRTISYAVFCLKKKKQQPKTHTLALTNT